MLPAPEPLKSLVGSGELKGTGETRSFPDNPAPGHSGSLGRPGQIYQNARILPAGSCPPRGPGDRGRLSSLPGGNRSLCDGNTPFSGKKKKKSHIIPQRGRNPAAKGLRAAAGLGWRRGRLRTRSNSISQREGGAGAGSRREEGRGLGKRLFLWEQPIRLAKRKREEKK